jgi:hypothetical protein
MIFLRPTEIGLARECLCSRRQFGRTFLLAPPRVFEFLHSQDPERTPAIQNFCSASMFTAIARGAIPEALLRWQAAVQKIVGLGLLGRLGELLQYRLFQATQRAKIACI